MSDIYDQRPKPRTPWSVENSILSENDELRWQLKLCRKALEACRRSESRLLELVKQYEVKRV